ncbi:50S ribosomal protein L17 [bacterium]|nr:50S ribosomal protein L17 [bacterium]
MRHLKTGRKLSRRKSHRTAMLTNLAASLIKSGRVKTTDAKAKEIRPFVERMVTFAKRGDLHARRIVLSRLKDVLAVKRLFDELGPRFADRLGGYTRILKLGFRNGDSAPVSLIEFVGEEAEIKAAKKTKTAKAKTRKKATKETGKTVETGETESQEVETEAVEASAEAEDTETEDSEEVAEGEEQAADETAESSAEDEKKQSAGEENSEKSE